MGRELNVFVSVLTCFISEGVSAEGMHLCFKKIEQREALVERT